MKTSKMFRILGLACAFCMVYGFASAQSQSSLEAKEELRATTGANYDTWKLAQSNQEVAPNKVLSTVTANHQTTHLIRLGYNLSNQDAAAALESKLDAQPGVISVDADHNTNTVEITIKEEDEHDALKSMFDIE